MWFAAFQNYAQNPWLVHLAVKLLRGDPLVNDLLAQDGNPFVTNGTIPKFVRGRHYEYIFNIDDGITGLLTKKLKSENNANTDTVGWTTGKWWKRKAIGEYMPPVSLDELSVQAFLKHYNWS
jgi:hypothetical protein